MFYQVRLPSGPFHGAPARADHVARPTTLTWLSVLMASVLMAGIGCQPPVAEFKLNLTYMAKMSSDNSVELTDDQIQDVANVLTAMFGTPDEPFLPEGVGMEEMVNEDNLKFAAGPVRTTELGSAGLYRRHCAHCHGTTGDGHGPTAEFLNPYPRDYRKSAYKFKSTPIGVRPTHDDLKRILQNGIAGTAMPSFHLLPEAEIEALVDYVKYLSIRGEVERRLWDELTQELDEGDRLVTADGLNDLAALVVEDFLGEAVAAWQEAEPTPVPKRPDWDEKETLVSIQKGKDLYYGAVANCVKCHGESQLGDGQTTDYDDWTKEFYDWGLGDAKKRVEKLNEYAALGGLPVRNILPRNLRQGVYRGGRRPIDIYWRVLHGIEGTPMPSASMKPEGSGPETPGLTIDDVWHLVDYMQSLPYESLATYGEDQPVLMRARP
jgi:mono/diheme cytochrome c family protein